jgi:sec-independent protein translocase protein TatB
VFGLSFGELCVLLIVAMVVLGPKELPVYLRKAGQVAGRLRRLASEMREKSGIDEVLRSEGIDREIAEIRRLARGEIGGVVSELRSTQEALRRGAPAATPYAGPSAPAAPEIVVSRDREYPSEGADSYGALPDTAMVYDGALPPSPLAGDAVYANARVEVDGSGALAGGIAAPDSPMAADAPVNGAAAAHENANESPEPAAPAPPDPSRLTVP